LLRHVLDNGLTVLLQENHAVRVAALQLWVRVGSADERADEAGLAHLHEHMLFKGTRRRGPGEIARTIESRGGHINAWTSYDQTVYHLVLASPFLDEGIDILADAVTESLFDPGELAREIEVVCEEIRRADDMPSRRISRSMFGLAYGTHPYKRPVIGSEESVRSFTREKILGFYNRHYSTPNMVFAAAGDFDPGRALMSIERAFQSSRTRPPERDAVRVPEPPQRAARATVTQAPIHEAHLSAAWHIGGVRSEDLAPIDLLALLLGQGDASRLTLEVKRERGLVNEIYASAYTPTDPGLFIAGATLPANNVSAALSEMLRQTYRARREEFTAADLARAKRLIESDTIYQRETVQGQARKLAFFETVAGHVDEEERYLAAVARATAGDLRAAAERYLRTENLSIALLQPEKGPTITDSDLLSVAAEAEQALTTAVSTRPAESYARLTSATGIPPPRDPGGIVCETLPNGVRLVVKEDHTVPLVAFRAAWVGGLRWENAGNNGVNHLLARSLLRGTERRSARELARAIDDLAGSVGGAAGRNSFGVRGEFLSADLIRGFDLFADVLLHPALSTDEVEKERALVLEDIRSRDDNPSSAVFSLFHQTLYNAHPYRMEPQGSLDSATRLTSEVLHAYRRENYRLRGLTLAVVGDVTPKAARELVLSHLTDDATALAHPPPVERDADLTGPREAQRRLDRKQAHLIIGFRGATLTSADRYPLEVLCAVLNGQGGRLFMELRDKRSMAYSVSAFASEGLDPGSIGVYIGTSPEKIADARAGLREQLERIQSEVVSDAELDRAHKLLMGGHEIGLQRLSARGAVMALDEAYGLGGEFHLQYPDRIRTVTKDDVLRVAQKYLDLNRSVTTLISPNA
jgi:zinc protease